MSILVFVVLALVDQNVVDYFYQAAADKTQDMLTTLGLVSFVIGSLFFFQPSMLPGTENMFIYF